MEENILLLLFAGLPFLTGYLVFRFFSKTAVKKKLGAQWPKIIIGNLLVLLFLISIFVLVAECYYRFVYDTTESFGLTKTTQRWLKQYYHSNESGFRDNLDVYTLKRIKGKPRITFLGDSFTAGHGIKDVDNRFANQVRRLHPEWDVHVFGQNGWDTGHELASIQAMLKQRYEIEVVVLVYSLNDVADIIPEWRLILQRIYRDSKPGWLAEHSYFFNTIHYRIVAANDPDISNYYQFTINAYQGKLWQQQKLRLLKLKEIITSRNGKLLVVTFPFVHAIGPDYPYKEVHKQLKAFWMRIGVTNLDMYDLYAGHHPAKLTVNAYDAHPNEYAHALAAPAIAEFIQKEAIK